MSRVQRIYLAAAAVALLVVGVVAGQWWAHRAMQAPADAAASADGEAAGDPEILYWYDPMVPDQHFDKPGKSPFMDMQLVPKYAESGAEEGASGVRIPSDARQNLGIRTVEAERGNLGGAISVPGTIEWDLRQEHVVSARVEAIIDRLFVKAPYEPVRAGQPLASILAPDWSTALAEANALAGADSESAKALRPAARARLRALGLPSGASVRNGRIVLTSPTSGVVSEIGAREGMSAPAGTLLFRINGTQTVWLRADIPQAGTAAIRPGTPVQARVSALPGRVFEGRVETLLPQLDPGSRTQQARIVLENEDGLLAPGMFAQISLAPLDGAEHVLVPSDAVIGSGDEARVIVMDDGRFRPVAVQVGRSSGGTTEILAGLKGGERVVASGQFLIDSEASLSGALQRLDTPAESGEESATPDEAPTEPAE
ncbi:MAG: efflux RND transporter periplasmic adaptor subunit [Pseudomonadota bacterium]|nr:efflux RND transporter periplasmic adaptor subunit [Pseudomonadota bacterium]